MRPSCLFFLLFLVPFLVFVSGDTRALRNRLMTLAKGLPFTRWHTKMVRPPGPRPRLKRPLEDRFARAPILTRYTPLVMDEDIKVPELTVEEVERVVEQPVVQYNNLQPSSLPVPLDHGWSGYEVETVDLTEGPKETTTVPGIKLVEIELPPDVDVVDMEDVAVALGQAGAIQLNWGESMREAVANGLQKISIEHPVVEKETYLSFPSRIQTKDTQESSLEEESGSNSKEEHFHEMYEPGVIQEQELTEDRVEIFQGLRIEDNFDLEVEQPKIPPPYQASDYTGVSLMAREVPPEVLGSNQRTLDEAGFPQMAVFRSSFFKNPGFSQEPFHIPDEFRAFLKETPDWLI